MEKDFENAEFVSACLITWYFSWGLTKIKNLFHWN